MHYLPRTKRQTGKVKVYLVNKVEHLAANEPVIFSLDFVDQNRAKDRFTAMWYMLTLALIWQSLNIDLINVLHMQLSDSRNRKTTLDG